MSKLLFVFAVPIMAATAAAQTSPSARPSTEPPASPPGSVTAAPPLTAPPQPAPELQKLGFLAGDWIHSENYYPGPMGPGGKGGGRSKTAWVLGSHHLMVTYKTKAPQGEIEGRGFLGWDAEKKAYRMDWFDSAGAALRYYGDFNPDGTLLLTVDHSVQGQRFKEQFSIKRQEDGKILFTSQMAGPDGSMTTVMESLANPEKK